MKKSRRERHAVRDDVVEGETLAVYSTMPQGVKGKASGVPPPLTPCVLPAECSQGAVKPPPVIDFYQ